jgi:predicted metal-binding transcription factor (methanogenesis marker protein 9)
MALTSHLCREGPFDLMTTFACSLVSPCFSANSQDYKRLPIRVR